MFLRYVLFAFFLNAYQNTAVAEQLTKLVVKNTSFNVEVADTPKAIEHGLMFRTFLPLTNGMLFVFNPPRQPSFWMKNTLIPLDMIFIDDRGVIVWIYEQAVPKSEKSIVCPLMVKAVLEVQGGTVKRLHIGIGDTVQHAIFN